jgi:hypothetical protein
MKRAAKLFGTLAAAVVTLYAAAALALGGPLTTAKDFTVDCVATAGGTLLTGAGVDGYNSIYCQNMSSTSVHFGGTGLTTATAPCISTNTSNCPKADFPWDVSLGAGPRCLSASGTITIKCLSGK